jgi:hypothetical protein
MNRTATALPLLSEKTCFDPARVVENERDDGTVQVILDRPGPWSIITAQVAASRTAPLAAGDRVLVAGDPSQELYVIGRIGPFRPEPQSQNALRTGSGACAVLSTDPVTASAVLQVYSPRKELVFEYDPIGGTARVNIARGRLELSTEDGDIELRSARYVRIGGHAIEMNSRDLNVKAASSRWVVDRMETLAGTLVEKSRNAYRTVEQLAQLKTGRMRTLVDQTFHFKSRKAFLKSDEDFKIKGEKIHLG